ncbi:MAG: hypothetical protein ACE5R6_13860 [Candidatus Heimdallarchaeota archaeon]
MKGASNNKYKPATMTEKMPNEKAEYTKSWYSKAKMAKAIAEMDRTANSSSSISIVKGILGNSCV